MGKKSKAKAKAPKKAEAQGRGAEAKAPHQAPGRPSLDDEDAIRASGECPGTFRWAIEKSGLPDLPTSPMASGAGTAAVGADYSRGWGPYLKSRAPENPTALVATAQASPAMIDALSFPLSILHATERMGLSSVLASMPKIQIIGLGASRRAEERVLLHTSYFEELALAFPRSHIDFTLVGPEMTATASKPPPPKGTPHAKFRGHCFRGTLSDFAAAHPEAVSGENTQP